MKFKTTRRTRLAFAATLVATTLGLVATGLRASDHADTAENVNRLGADLTDVFIFPSATNANNVVLAMDVRGLIPSGQAANFSFDPNVLYQFKVDTTGDYVEDLVIQAKFNGTGQGQQVLIAGPMAPPAVGTASYFGRRLPTTGTINTMFSPTAGMTVFAGPREDPFFFDLNQFYKIFPDRKTPLTGQVQSIANPNAPVVTTFRGFNGTVPGGDTTPSMDFLAGFNVLSIVVELPRASLGGGVINVWATTSVFTGSPNYNYTQQDRLARPVVNEALATVSNLRHHVNNFNNPTDDAGQLKNDIESFLTFPAGRSTAIKNFIEAVLVPDVLVADLSQHGSAAYLGHETGGATAADHSTFGGRKLADDVVDISLSVVFGNTVPALTAGSGSPIPDDRAEIPSLVTDNVDARMKHYLAGFPYLGNPQ